MKIIVGLGNPGKKYKETRHNLGAECVLAFAEKFGMLFKKEDKFHSYLASATLKRPNVQESREPIQEVKVVLLLPFTYMNCSGVAVKKGVDFFKDSQPCFSDTTSEGQVRDKRNYASHVLIVVDDVYLPFGAMRLRFTGSSGGHNGLKDIEACLGSKDYPRLKLGIGPQGLPEGKFEIDVPLEQYVLDPFNQEEKKEIPQFLQKGIAAIETWLFENQVVT